MNDNGLRQGRPAVCDLPNNVGMLSFRCTSSRDLRRGFTLIEMLITVAMIAILVGMAAPNVARDITHSRVNNAAQVVAGELENAVSLAGRQRRPLRVIVDGAAKELRLVDRASGTLISRRQLGDATSFKLYSVAGSPSTIDLLPQGTGTGPSVITLTAGTYSRRVTMTRAGLVRVVP